MCDMSTHDSLCLKSVFASWLTVPYIMVDSLLSRCTCGNCNVEMLQNVKECYCCQEIENCVDFIDSFYQEFVTGGQGDKGTFNCITDHPGFEAMCLNKWSLELAAENFKTRDGHRYRQSGSKKRYKTITV